MNTRVHLINARKQAKLTQVEIAKLLEISDRHYQALEAGSSDGSIKIWRKLKEILNAPYIDLLLEQENNDNT